MPSFNIAYRRQEYTVSAFLWFVPGSTSPYTHDTGQSVRRHASRKHGRGDYEDTLLSDRQKEGYCCQRQTVSTRRHVWVCTQLVSEGHGRRPKQVDRQTCFGFENNIAPSGMRRNRNMTQFWQFASQSASSPWAMSRHITFRAELRSLLSSISSAWMDAVALGRSWQHSGERQAVYGCVENIAFTSWGIDQETLSQWYTSYVHTGFEVGYEIDEGSCFEQGFITS